MAPDDLNTPLGQHKPKKGWKLPIGAPQFVAGLLGLCGAVVVGWAALVNDPLGGEPVAIVSTRAPAPATAAAGKSGAGHDTHYTHYDGPAQTPPAASATAKTAAAPADGQTVTIIDGSSGASRDVVIPRRPSDSAAKAAADKTLLEVTRQGAIPKVGAGGLRAAAAYAQPRNLPPDRKDFPRIAVIVTGLGISASGTADALSQLPAPVTLALSPYGEGLQKLADDARADKHEVLLQVPMEPFDYPDNDPGPQSLLTSLPADQNIARLHWLMGRFQGYVGLVNSMGARFTASEQALAPVLDDVAKRGLIFVDNGASPRSVAGQLAGGRNLPSTKADVVLDTVPTAVEIERALTRLELVAREKGSAVGLANAQPAVVARIAAWAKSVEKRGFVLVPVTMVATKAKSS